MINIPYLKQTIKSNVKFLFVFTLVLCFFLIVMSYVFTPEAMNSLQEATKTSAVKNILSGNGTLIGFMANSFYALMAIIFPMVYSIMVGNRMIAEKVDKGSMAGFLSTPVSRNAITISSAIYLIFSLAFMWIVASLVGVAAANHFQPDALDVETFLLLNVGAFLYHLVIGGICFCSSCVFNSSKNSLTFGAGIPLFFFVVNMLLKLSDDLEGLKYVTLNTLYDTQSVVAGSDYMQGYIIMGILAVLLYSVGILYFNQKDLPL